MLFLALNGHRMTADNGQIYVFTMALAAGEIDETGALILAGAEGARILARRTN